MRAFIGSMALTALLIAPEASASFHFMQIEQAIGGVNGDATQQAIQLRMRFGGQNLVSNSRLIVRDAAGANPVTVIDMTSDVTIFSAGARVLIASPAYAAAHGPGADFAMANLIPTSYLAAGRLTFESDSGTIYWSVAWGGAGYTGSHQGDVSNDADLNFGPAINVALPSTGLRSLLFPGTAGAPSTSNPLDYGVSADAASFTNNAGLSRTAGFPDRVFRSDFENRVLP